MMIATYLSQTVFGERLQKMSFQCRLVKSQSNKTERASNRRCRAQRRSPVRILLLPFDLKNSDRRSAATVSRECRPTAKSFSDSQRSWKVVDVRCVSPGISVNI